jgi:hypothetical protein
MNIFFKAIIILTFATALAVPNARAQQQPLSFDEFGVSNFGPGVLTADPFNGGQMTLMYTLPFNVVAGDLTILEPQASTGDLLRFENGNQLFVYSDNVEGSDSPADVGIPANLQTNTFQIVESGPEGNNGAIWNPSMGNPGDAGFAVQYNFTSDSTRVPEPSIGLVVLGGLLLVCRLYWRVRKQIA